MKLWGLTGGIASGKTTIGKMFAAHGVPVLNADATYHGLLQPQQGAPSMLAQCIAEVFSELPLLRPDGSLDRGVLGKKVFEDASARATLEALTHPAVAAATAEATAALAQAGAPQAIYDVPLLFEKNLQARFAGIILVWVPHPVQKERLVKRDGLSEDNAIRRLQAQMPLDDKRAQARWVIDNSGTLSASSRRVAVVLQEMQQALASTKGAQGP